MKNKLIEHIETLIEEHEENQFCTSYDEAAETLATDVEGGADMFYDVGRYEALKEVLRMVQTL